MPVFAKAVEHQVYPNSFKLADDACVVQRAMLLDQPQRTFQARQVFRPAAPASNPDSIKVPTNGHRQLILSTMRARRGGLWRFLLIMNEIRTGHDLGQASHEASRVGLRARPGVSSPTASVRQRVSNVTPEIRRG